MWRTSLELLLILYYPTKANLTDFMEEIYLVVDIVADTKAAKASNINTTKNGLVQDNNYTGLN